MQQAAMKIVAVLLTIVAILVGILGLLLILLALDVITTEALEEVLSTTGKIAVIVFFVVSAISIIGSIRTAGK